MKVSHEKNSQILSLVEIKKEKTNRRLIESKRNIKKLFYSRQKTLLQCSLFSKVLSIMKRYVFLFQQNETVIFRLFLEQLLLLRELFCILFDQKLLINIEQLHHLCLWTLGFSDGRNNKEMNFFPRIVDDVIWFGLELTKSLNNDQIMPALLATGKAFFNYLWYLQINHN